MRSDGTGERRVSSLNVTREEVIKSFIKADTYGIAQDFPKARERLEELKRSGKNGPRQRERITRSKIGQQNEGECSVM
jgi:hypothetical protein